MNLIIGGAFQGKRDFARQAYGYQETDIFTCSGTEIDFSKPCIDQLEEFVFSCIQQNLSPLDYLKAHENAFENSTIICMDIFCGVVPLGADMRKWRQETGLLCQYLSKRAERVSRIFCGLEQRLK